MVPDGWQLITLGDACVPKDGLQTGPFGSQLHAHEYVSDGVPVVMPRDLDSGRIMDVHIARVSQGKADALARHKLKASDIIFARRGDIGRYAVVSEDEEGWLCGTGCVRARPLSSISSMFLGYEIGLTRSIAWLNSNAVGQTMLNLNTEILAELPLLLPPKPEQEQIASILSTWDRAIAQAASLIGAKRNLKKGLMQQLLTGKRCFVGDFSKPKTVKRGEVANIRRGASPRPIDDPKWFSDTGRGWVRISDVTACATFLRKTSQYLSALGESKSVKVDPGDLIMSICATIGVPRLVDMHACIHDGFVVLRDFEDVIDKYFLFHYISFITDRLAHGGQPENAKGTSIRQLSGIF